MSTITQRDRDCLSCRVIGGGGLVGAGTYVFVQARKFEKGVLPMRIISFGLISLGFARLLQLPPFDVPFNAKNDNQL